MRLWGQSESTGPGAGLFPTYDLSIQLGASADVQVPRGIRGPPRKCLWGEPER